MFNLPLCFSSSVRVISIGRVVDEEGRVNDCKKRSQTSTFFENKWELFFYGVLLIFLNVVAEAYTHFFQPSSNLSRYI